MRQERNAVLFWTKKMREGVKAGMGGGGMWVKGKKWKTKISMENEKKNRRVRYG